VHQVSIFDSWRGPQRAVATAPDLVQIQ